MKKFLSLTLALVMVLALAVPALAAGNLYNAANGWYYSSDAAGTVTVKDNKIEFTYNVTAGDTLLGLQRDYTGQLKFVSFVPAVFVCPGHEFINDTGEVIAPTCTEGGFNVSVCSVLGCDTLGTRPNGVPALGHEFINDTGVIKVSRTCTVDGINEAACSRLGCDEIGTRILPAFGHFSDAYDKKEPSCDVDGYFKRTCDTCGELYVNEVIPALGHYMKPKNIEATCVVDGETGYICTRDGCNHKDVTVIPALGHDYVLAVSASRHNLQNSTNVTFTVTGDCSCCGGKMDAVTAAYNVGQSAGTRTYAVGVYTVTIVVNQNNMISSVNVSK